MREREYTVAPEELIVDCFAGGGGASTGIEAALGRPIDVAINHSAEALAVHAANHPRTRHLHSDVWEVDPVEACAGRPVGLLWASPDCTHHSRAKGGKPRSRKLRGLAWVVTRWAKAVRPRVICLENVEEFATWGPLDADGKPCPRRAGRTFRAWLSKLRSYGYRVEWRSLVAADYGTPTTRRRLFLIARCDGEPISWPAPTHGKGRALPWRAAAEVVDWALPCPSIFGRKRPLAEATLRRIAAGVRRYVLESGRPFLVPVTHPRDARVHGTDEPFRTVTAAHRGELALVAPLVARTDMHQSNAGCVYPAGDALRTITTGGGLGVVAATLAQMGYGEREGQAPRALDVAKPLGTVVAGGTKHAVVAALMTKHYGGVVGHGVEQALGTVTTVDHHALTTATLAPASSEAASFVTKFYGTSTGAEAQQPLPTVTGGGWHLAEVRAFLVKYYGADGRPGASQQSLFDPVHTVTSKARFGLVTVHGQEYAIVDIGLRMLTPRELFAAQGFPGGYEIAAPRAGKPLSKTAQIRLAGNSVCPQVAEAIVAANLRGRVAEVA